MGFTVLGGKVESVKAFKEQTKNKGGGGKFATRLPKDGSAITVRFLKDIPEWVFYDRTWDGGLGRYVVLTEENQERYAEQRTQRCYLAPALEKSENRVVALELVKSLAQIVEEAVTRKERDITTGDFELWKTGEGKETRYHAEWQGIEKIDIARYEAQAPDLWKIVEGMVEPNEDENAVDDVDDDTDDEAVAEAPAPKAEAPARRVVLKNRG